MSEANQSLEEFLFESALAKPDEAERAAFLDGVCRDNPALRGRLGVLLEGHFQADGFLTASSKKVREKPAAPLPPEEETASTIIGRYKLLEKIGEGGFGEVWMAEQKEPVRRRVALKIIKLGMDTKQVVARFEAERQALAMMDHPNIAKVLDAGATDTGRLYFVMELVRGVRITDFCDQHQLPTQERLKLFTQVCRAIQHAHQKGIIHRDIKPSNILVTLHDGQPVPKVIDFGIAKATQMELTEKTVFTQFHQFLGTPAYVSPEQAGMSGLDVDTRSDIYSLGVLLYELLTGATPFDTQELLKAGLEGMCRIIREREPLRPSTRLMRELAATQARTPNNSKFKIQNSKIESDLDWIVMKCLEKDRARRYETASGLARDIERHLSNEPVLARPPSRLYEFRKTVRRHWAGFLAAGAILAALAIAIVGSTVEAVRARRAESDQIGLRRGEAEQRARAEANERLGQKLLYAAKMNLAQAAWEQNRIVQVHELLDETAAYPERGFEWYYWQRQTHLDLRTLRGHLDLVMAAAFSPDGQRILSAGQDALAKVWDAATGEELLTLRGHRLRLGWAAFSPDGRRIVTCSMDATAKIWDADAGKELLTLEGHTRSVDSAKFSPDSRRVATASLDGTAMLWDAATGKKLLTFRGHDGPVSAVAFSPDGQRVASCSRDQTARIWDVDSGKELICLRGHGGLWAVGLSPDGQKVVTGSDDCTAQVWEATTGKLLLTLTGHGSMINTTEFSHDGQRILTSSDDYTAKIWDAATGKERITLKGHSDKVNSAAFSPDGRRVVTGSDDKAVKLWELDDCQGALTLAGHSSAGLAAAFFPDGQRIATCSADLTAKVYNARDGSVELTLRGHTQAVRCVAVSPDGRRILTGSDDQKARLWDATTGGCLMTLAGHSGPINGVAFSPDGIRIATASADRTVRLWGTSGGKNLGAPLRHQGAVLCVAFSSDGTRLVTGGTGQPNVTWVEGTDAYTRLAKGGADLAATVWDARSGTEQIRLQTRQGGITSAAFSADGRWIVTGGFDHTARVWDSSTGKELLTLKGHSDSITSVAFSPDGQRILTGGADRTAKLWDASDGEELLSLKGHIDVISSVAFSADGRRIGTASWDSTSKIWDAASAEQVAAWRQQEEHDNERLAALARQRVAAVEQKRAASIRDPGAIKQWLVLGPVTFVAPDGGSALAREQIPGEAHLRGRLGELVQVGGSEWIWRAMELDDYLLDLPQRVRGGEPWNPNQRSNPPWPVAYALCYIVSEANRTNLEMHIGSERESKVYLNGQEIYRYDKPREYVPDQDVVSDVSLKAGSNVLVLKLISLVFDLRASIRFSDAAGRPVQGISVTLTPPADGAGN